MHTHTYIYRYTSINIPASETTCPSQLENMDYITTFASMGPAGQGPGADSLGYIIWTYLDQKVNRVYLERVGPLVPGRLFEVN